MDILFLTDSYPPEIRSASHLIHGFACGLKEKGHRVTVITTMPRYNLAREHIAAIHNIVMNEDGITVIRTKSFPLHNIGYFKRGIAYLRLPFVFCKAAKKFVSNRPDIIVAYSPPLTLGVAGARLKDYFSAKFILNIQDIFPQNAIDLGIINNHWIAGFFEWVERYIYKKADKITVHSEGNRKFLIQRKGVSSDKIEVVYNWASHSLVNEGGKKGEFRELYNVGSGPVILFAGVLGPAQGLDVIINVAKKLEDKSKAHFVFVGNGTEKEKLMSKAKKMKLSNVSFHPFVSKENYPCLLKEVDVGLVCLSNRNKTPVVPGKLAGYMAAGLPVLAVLNKESDGHEIIKHAECGFSFYPEDESGIIEAVLSLENNFKFRTDMGEKGREFARRHFSRENAINKYEEIFENVLGG